MKNKNKIKEIESISLDCVQYDNNADLIDFLKQVDFESVQGIKLRSCLITKKNNMFQFSFATKPHEVVFTLRVLKGPKGGELWQTECHCPKNIGERTSKWAARKDCEALCVGHRNSCLINRSLSKNDSIIGFEQYIGGFMPGTRLKLLSLDHKKGEWEGEFECLCGQKEKRNPTKVFKKEITCCRSCHRRNRHYIAFEDETEKPIPAFSTNHPRTKEFYRKILEEEKAGISDEDIEKHIASSQASFCKKFETSNIQKAGIEDVVLINDSDVADYLRGISAKPFSTQFYLYEIRLKCGNPSYRFYHGQTRQDYIVRVKEHYSNATRKDLTNQPLFIRTLASIIDEHELSRTEFIDNSRPELALHKKLQSSHTFDEINEAERESIASKNGDDSLNSKGGGASKNANSRYKSKVKSRAEEIILENEKEAVSLTVLELAKKYMNDPAFSMKEERDVLQLLRTTRRKLIKSGSVYAKKYNQAQCPRPDEVRKLLEQFSASDKNIKVFAKEVQWPEAVLRSILNNTEIKSIMFSEQISLTKSDLIPLVQGALHYSYKLPDGRFGFYPSKKLVAIMDYKNKNTAKKRSAVEATVLKFQLLNHPEKYIVNNIEDLVKTAKTFVEQPGEMTNKLFLELLESLFALDMSREFGSAGLI